MTRALGRLRGLGNDAPLAEHEERGGGHVARKGEALLKEALLLVGAVLEGGPLEEVVRVIVRLQGVGLVRRALHPRPSRLAPPVVALGALAGVRVARAHHVFDMVPVVDEHGRPQVGVLGVVGREPGILGVHGVDDGERVSRRRGGSCVGHRSSG
ncbi:MAG: hypothetical protein CL844_03890 [Crocinitomicaceae bacterium]|nr:hypothetical protein [Crocinitomicaceae bacterium]